MDTFTWGALMGGVLGTALGYARTTMSWITGLFVVRVNFGQLNSPSEASTHLALWAWTLRHMRSPFYTIIYQYTWVRSLGRATNVPVEVLGTSAHLFFKGWRPLLISDDRLTYLRGTFNADQLVAEVETHWRTTEVDLTDGMRFRIERHAGNMARRWGQQGGGESGQRDKRPQTNPDDRMTMIRSRIVGRSMAYQMSDLGEPKALYDPLKRMALDEHVVDAIDEVRRWHASRAWYAEREIPWRRGLLLTGEPGTGKSSLVRAIAQTMNMPIHLFDIATMSNDDFVQAWQQTMADGPCVALIEDIDSVFKGRTNLMGEQGGGLSFDCVLNTISGVQRADGVLLVITTNDMSTVDVALSGGKPGDRAARPGRIDRVVQLGQPSVAGRRKIAEHIVRDQPAVVEELVAQGDGLTGAQFQELCVHRALADYWTAQHERSDRLRNQSSQGGLESRTSMAS